MAPSDIDVLSDSVSRRQRVPWDIRVPIEAEINVYAVRDEVVLRLAWIGYAMHSAGDVCPQ